MSRALRERIARLERQRDRRPFPRVIFGIYDKEDADIIGFAGDRAGTRIDVMRLAGEPLEACEARAWELVGSPSLFTLYSPASARQSSVAAPAHAPAPEPAPVDPFALAGVGKRASRQQLIQMGVIPVPPERLV